MRAQEYKGRMMDGLIWHVMNATKHLKPRIGASLYCILAWR